MAWLSLLILAFAVSLDGFGVGITYGLRKIRFPWWSLVVVISLSITSILIAMLVGSRLATVLSPQGARYLGAFILMAVGVWAVYHMITKKEDVENGQIAAVPLVQSLKPTIYHIELKKIGLIIQILRSPSIADIDRSGEISIKEAVLLGVALSMDGFGAGVGASLIGFPPLLTALTIAGMNAVFILSGLRIGMKYADVRVMQKMSYLPGIMLIVIGLFKIFSP